MIEIRMDAPDLTVGEVADLTVRLVNTGEGVCSGIVCVLDFPGLVVVAGSGRFEVDRMPGGAVVERTLRVRPLSAGMQTATSRNFSYRDDRGRSHRVSTLAVPLPVRAAEPKPKAGSAGVAGLAGPAGSARSGHQTDRPDATEAPPPLLEISLRTRELVLGEATLLLGCVRNSGLVPIRRASISVSGQLAVRSREGNEIRDLEPGESADFSFYVSAQQPGPHVPITTKVDYVDRHDRRYVVTPRHAVRVDRAPSATTVTTAGSVRVLFLAADPSSLPHLRLDHELRAIREVIERSTFRAAFELVDHTAVRLGDVSRALLQAKARIVHFAGHGDRRGHYQVEAEDGSAVSVRADKLAELFAAATDDVECVIVNACHTMRLAEALAEHVRFVVGMRREVYDQDAIRFSTGFYQALSEGLPVDRAFRVGKALAEADAGSSGPDDVPELVTLLR